MKKNVIFWSSKKQDNNNDTCVLLRITKHGLPVNVSVEGLKEVLNLCFRKSVSERSIFGRIFFLNSVADIKENGCWLWIVQFKGIWVQAWLPFFPLKGDSLSTSSLKKEYRARRTASRPTLTSRVLFFNRNEFTYQEWKHVVVKKQRPGAVSQQLFHLRDSIYTHKICKVYYLAEIYIPHISIEEVENVCSIT